MGLKYLWDTNTVIYYLQNHFTPAAERFIDEIIKTSPPAISVITEIELMCWKTTKEEDLKILTNFISEVIIFGLEKDVKIGTADIRKAHNIKLPDAIIAATAKVHRLKLITRNVEDFKKVRSLEIINPYNQ